MTTSDSEAFESADEDFIDKYPKQVTAVSDIDKNVSKKTLDTSDSSVPAKVLETGDQKRVAGFSDNETNISIVSDNSCLKSDMKEKRRRNQRQPVERKQKQSMKLGVKMDHNIPKEPKPRENVTPTSLENTLPSNSGGDKSDNDWDDFDVEEHIQNAVDNKSHANVLQSDSEIIGSMGNADIEPGKTDDGWGDDFDDWGNADSQTTNVEKDEKNNNPLSTANEHTEEEYKKLVDRLSSLGSEKSGETAGGGWGSWGTWGVGSLLSSGVAHVSQGFNMVSNVIETGMGLPDPEDLARSQKEAREKKEAKLGTQKAKSEYLQKEETSSNPEKEKMADKFIRQESKSKDESLSKGNTENDDGAGVFKLGKLVSSVTKLVESTGSAVVTGGLDTLEEIGKRTMRVLQGEEEGKKRLSTLLRESRVRGEQTPQSDYSQTGIKKKTPQFEALFDDFQGLVYLEALEMLSKQCDMRIQSLLMGCEGRELTELKETLNQVKEICELPDPDDEDDEQSNDGEGKLNAESFNNKLVEVTKEMGVKLTFEALVTSCEDVHKDVTEDLSTDTEGVNMEKEAEKVGFSAISNLALCSALSVQILHKTTALLAVRERRSTADEADGLTHLTSTLSSYIGDVAAAYSQKLHKIAKLCEKPEKVNEIITAIFLEAGKGTSYVCDAFQLTIPILQVGAT